MKKIFVLILTFCLFTAVFCATAFAEDKTSSAGGSKPPVDVLRISGQKTNGDTVELVEIETYTVFDDGWNQAMTYAIDMKYLNTNGYDRIVVDLLDDWIATDGEFTDEFWNGKGFNWDAIYFYDKARITLNMNGFTIDRGLTGSEFNGEVMYVSNGADVIINGGKIGDPIIKIGEEAEEGMIGTIKGGNSDNGAGGIHINDDAKVTLNNVIIKGNVAEGDDGGGIAIYDDATLIMNGGGFVSNINDTFSLDGDGALGGFGAAIYIEDSTATFNDVLFDDNYFAHTSGNGAAIYAKKSTVSMNGCKVYKNGQYDNDAKKRGLISVMYAKSSEFDIKNTDFVENGAYTSTEGIYTKTTIFNVDSSDITIDNCTFTGNLALSYLFKINSGKLCVSNSTFNDNSCCIYKGHDAEFTNCTFTNNVNRADRITFNIDSDKSNVVFTDCDTGTSVFSNEKYVKFVDSSLTAEDTAGSFFGEGSIAMIVSLVSLAISVCVAIAFYKTKATPASGATADEE